MKKCRALLTRLRYRVEISTGVIWGGYALNETWADKGETTRPPFYVMLNSRHPKVGPRLVAVEVGVGSHGYYLSWGHR